MNEIQAMITQEEAKVFCNFDQVREAINARLAVYDGMEFTEDSKAAAKKEVASLRADKKAFQDNLRTAKKAYMEPWEQFEVQAKDLISLYDKPINLISGRILEFEEKRIAERRKLIQSIYEDVVHADLRDYIPLDKISDQRWTNASVSKKKIRDELCQISETTQSAIDTIRNMDSEATEHALDIYGSTLSLAKAISYINDYERQKAEILLREQERKKQEIEERIRREEREKILAEQRAQAEKAAAVQRAREEAAKEAIESLIPGPSLSESWHGYRILLSDEAKEALEMYMNSVGIEWEET